MSTHGAIAALIAMLLSGGAMAACIGLKDFTAKGGDLVEVRGFVHAGIPDDFLCDRVACEGTVGFSGIVDKDGRVRKLVETSNTWTVQPEEHAAFIRERAARVRYEPPRLKGRPVCVRVRWIYAFTIGAMK